MNADPILKSIQVSENKKRRGCLKIFLGMAAGVGKTYTMLEAAHKRQEEGIDVIVGIVYTHGRAETAKLLEHLRLIPEKTVIYKEKRFKELDLDAIIKIKPQLVLVDELAHSNIPGSKHVKRWQDVIEILEWGIDVYTTLNIQHIESYKDIIEEIAGIKIGETVPDLMLEEASEIEFVDLTPTELLQRLKEGKVYTGEFTAIALQNFFQEDRLTALREIALRYTAEKVDQELHKLVIFSRKEKGWRPHERLLVAINQKPYAQQLIRGARRFAFALHAPWFVVFVDDGTHLTDQERNSLTKHFALARELGASVVTTQDIDIAQALQHVAEQEEITQIFIGKGSQSHLFSHSLADKLSKMTSGIDIVLTRHSASLQKAAEKTDKSRWNPLSRFKKRQQLLDKKERSTRAMYEIIREISSAPTSAHLFAAVRKKLGDVLQGCCEIIVQKGEGGLNYQEAPVIAQDEKEKAIVYWVYENGKEAGWSTQTLPFSQFLYIPLKGFKETVGVLAFRSLENKPLLPEESNFFYTVAQQLAYFLERSFAEKRELKNQFIKQIEQIYSHVLESIAHELYTPFKTIQNAVVDFKQEQIVIENVKLLTLLGQIEKISENLIRIAESARAMAKLSSGAITFEKSFHDVAQWIHACCSEMESSFKNHILKIQIQQQLPQVPFDFSLMTILLRHLLQNAVEYSPHHTTIEITAEAYDGTFSLSVSDEGKGIPKEIMNRIFEKFYRVQGAASAGLGLGLAIVKSIAEIHEGTIQVRNRPSGGTSFFLLLPLS